VTGSARTRSTTVAVIATLALAACADTDLGAENSGGGQLRYFVTEPTHLFPGMTNESGGFSVVSALFSPLIRYDPETAAPYPVVAAELPTSDDGVVWTIKVADGWTFHNGERVTAKSFLDAWNWTAYGPNAALTGYYFSNVVGYADVQGGDDPDADGPQTAPRPGAATMSGLQLVDELTFTVTLAQPNSQLPLMLGLPAFYPVPSTCIDNWEACDEAPIGNGPFRLNGEWEHGRRITVVSYDGYAGPAPDIGGIDFLIYPDTQTGYDDLVDGKLDYLSDVPAEMVASARLELGDRLLSTPSAVMTYLGFPLWDDRFGLGGAESDYGGKPGQNLRHALSMAIDRQALIGSTPGKTVRPADALVSPLAHGYRAGACGEWCTYDVAAARELYAASPGISGPITLWFFGGSRNSGWLAEVGDFWQEAFGIEYELKEVSTTDFFRALGDRTMDGPFALFWLMDYPSPENFLHPHFLDDNYGYVDEMFNGFIAAGASADSIEASLESYKRAEDVILDVMPTMPIFFGELIGGHSERITNVSVDLFGSLDLTEVTIGAEPSG
jgi:oligopeptide transport system substrate-binding protein